MRPLAKCMVLCAFLMLVPRLSAQTTTAYGITFPNAHPRLFWSSARLTAAQTWITANSYVGETRTDSIARLDDTLFTCFAGSGMGGTIGTNAVTACANIIAWANAFTAACSSGPGCDGMRTTGFYVFLVMDWLYPGCGKASCLSAGNITSLITLWNTYMTNQDAPGQTWGNLGMPASNYFSGQVRNDILFGIASYIDNASADGFLAYGANKTVNFQGRWNDYLNYNAQTGSPQGTVDTAQSNTGYGLPNQEGTQYGRYNANYFALANNAVALDGRDLWTETPAFKSMVLAAIYDTTPEQTTIRSMFDMFEWSDDEDWVNGTSGPDSRYWCDYMELSAQEFSAISIGKLARTWLSTVGSTNCGPTFLSIDAGGSSQAFSTLPLDYYAAGPQYMFTRNNWTATGSANMWQLGIEGGGAGHTHNDAGTFQLYRKGTWLAKETTCYSESVAGFNDVGLVQCEDGLAHNIPIIGGQSMVNAGCHDGRGIVQRLESQTNYAFAVLDNTKNYQNTVCDGSHPARMNGHVVSAVREFYYIRGLDTTIIFDRLQNDLSTTSTTFTSHCPVTMTLTSPTATCITNGMTAKYTALIPATPTMVSVNEHDNSAACVTTAFGECQFRLESTNATPGNVVNYMLNVIQACDSGSCALTPSVVDSAPGTPSTGTFTVTIDGSDSIVINKGIASSGGTITVAGITTSLATGVEKMTVTDSGPVWGLTPWTGILDPTRATDWSAAGIAGGIPVRNTISSTLTSSATTTTINAAIQACGSGQVVLLSAGTYTITGGITTSGISNCTLRGAGPLLTILNFTTAGDSCNGLTSDICIKPTTALYTGSPATQPGGAQACNWTAGFAPGTTSITLGSCGGAPPNGALLVLDQANDTADNSGLIICDAFPLCRQNSGGNANGRTIGGVNYSSQQIVTITSVSGGGPYTVGISPPLRMNNWRIGQTPGAWWPNNVSGFGIENMTVDHTNAAAGVQSGINITNCLGCWVQNVRSIKANRNHIWLNVDGHTVIRDSYFFDDQNHASQSYGIEPQEDSDHLIENNIFQQVTSPFVYGQGSGNVDAYNFTIGNPWTSPSNFMQDNGYHNAGNELNLEEGNSFNGWFSDDVWGTSAVNTFFRNRDIGWQTGKTNNTLPMDLNQYARGFNIVGNVLGQVAYSTVYESAGPGPGSVCNTTIFTLGFPGGGASCSGTGDSITKSTLKRWGNYDVVNAAVRWDNTESSPGAVAFIAAETTPANHTLPASFYLSAKPSWWNTEPYPPIGPDVTGGSGPGGFAYNIPAQDCAINILGMPSDGSGAVLAFDSALCIAAAPPPGTGGYSRGRLPLMRGATRIK